MISKVTRFAKAFRSRQQIAIGMARAAATAPLRVIDERHPASWEFRAFSQHGEDGILDYLTRRIIKPDMDFVEVGIGDGIENNSLWFLLARNFSGLMIDGNPQDVAWANHILYSYNYGVSIRQLFVTLERLGELTALVQNQTPDFVSLDIDGNDYWVVEALLKSGILPKVWVLEYNAAFGPERALSLPYKADFCASQGYADSLYFGCSLSAWKKLMSRFGYRFLTVDSTGTNAFFVAPTAFQPTFLQQVTGMDYRNNQSHVRNYGFSWERQFALVSDRTLVEV